MFNSCHPYRRHLNERSPLLAQCDHPTRPGTFLRRLWMSVALAFVMSFAFSFSASSEAQLPASAGCAPLIDDDGRTHTQVAVARGRVEVLGGMHHITGIADEIVRRVHVLEGERVTAGTVLIELEDERQRLALRIAQAEENRARAALAALEARLPYERKRVARMKSAALHGGMEAQRLSDAQEALRAHQSDIATARALLQAVSARVAAAQWEVDRRTLRAPSDGVVVNINARIGADSAANTPLVVLLPDAPLVVRAEIGANFASLIEPGMPAVVIGDARADSDAVKSRVTSVGAVYVDGGHGEGAVRAATRVLESIIEVPAGSTLKAGQLVRVKFYAP